MESKPAYIQRKWFVCALLFGSYSGCSAGLHIYRSLLVGISEDSWLNAPLVSGLGRCFEEMAYVILGTLPGGGHLTMYDSALAFCASVIVCWVFCCGLIWFVGVWLIGRWARNRGHATDLV